MNSAEHHPTPPPPGADGGGVQDCLNVPAAGAMESEERLVGNEGTRDMQGRAGEVSSPSPFDSPLSFNGHPTASPPDPTDTTPKVGTAPRGSSSIGHQRREEVPVDTVEDFILAQRDPDSLGSTVESDASLPSTPSKPAAVGAIFFAPRTPTTAPQVEVHPGKAQSNGNPSSGTLTERLMRSRTKARAELANTSGRRAEGPETPGARSSVVMLAFPALGRAPGDGANEQEAASSSQTAADFHNTPQTTPLPGKGGDWTMSYDQYIAEAGRMYFAQKAAHEAANAVTSGEPKEKLRESTSVQEPESAPPQTFPVSTSTYSALAGWDGGASAPNGHAALANTGATAFANLAPAQQQVLTVQALLAQQAGAATTQAQPPQHAMTPQLPGERDRSTSLDDMDIDAPNFAQQAESSIVNAPSTAGDAPQRADGYPLPQTAPRPLTYASVPRSAAPSSHDLTAAAPTSQPVPGPSTSMHSTRTPHPAELPHPLQLLPDRVSVPANWAAMLNESGVLAVICEPAEGFPEFHGIGLDCALQGMSARKKSGWRMLDPEVDIIVFVQSQTDFYEQRGYLKAVQDLVTVVVEKVTGEKGFEITKPDKETMGLQDGDYGRAWLIHGLSPFGRALFRTQSAWLTRDVTLKLISTYRGLSRYVASYKGFDHDKVERVRGALLETLGESGDLAALASILSENNGHRPGVNYDLMAEEEIRKMEIVVYRETLRSQTTSAAGGSNEEPKGEYIASLYCDPPVREPLYHAWLEWCQNVANRELTSTFHDDAAVPWFPVRCTACHGCDHDRINCPFARIPGWDGALRVKFEENGANFTTEAPPPPHASDGGQHVQPAPHEPGFCYYQNPKQAAAGDSHWTAEPLPAPEGIRFVSQWKPPRPQQPPPQPQQTTRNQGAPMGGYSNARQTQPQNGYGTLRADMRTASPMDPHAAFGPGGYRSVSAQIAPQHTGYANSRTAPGPAGYTNARAGPSNLSYASARAAPLNSSYANAHPGPSTGSYYGAQTGMPYNGYASPRVNAFGGSYGGPQQIPGGTHFQDGPPPAYDYPREQQQQRGGGNRARRAAKQQAANYPPYGMRR
ncbi:uncharacterized protein TRAVEDRAFT_25106 [Trametes versicolor FP-101664 SS1]|uniref:Uncharacterized protein n=1 Tax=Trametes versicolor (strain FP-101664) TaxID=717944 RepID=R7S6B1_TRAVS|nr:uncharacterized protein TRAVEDRAFT_25106 [Trametes versicolor FP-101664 SS1]EIW51371.1 hypothetical protein TRAVEDRAFT_25106 [Trametes versicolor FP-101664 SS1]